MMVPFSFPLPPFFYSKTVPPSFRLRSTSRIRKVFFRQVPFRAPSQSSPTLLSPFLPFWWQFLALSLLSSSLMVIQSQRVACAPFSVNFLALGFLPPVCSSVPLFLTLCSPWYLRLEHAFVFSFFLKLLYCFPQRVPSL